MLVYRKSFFGQHINVFEIFLRLIARGKRGEKKAAGGAEKNLPSLIQQNIFFTAFLLFLKTGFTACLSKTLKITPFLSFFSDPHFALLGSSEALVAAVGVRCQGSGRARPWLLLLRSHAARAEHRAALELGDIAGPCPVTFGHSSDAVTPLSRRDDGHRGLGLQTADTEQRSRASCTRTTFCGTLRSCSSLRRVKSKSNTLFVLKLYG